MRLPTVIYLLFLSTFTLANVPDIERATVLEGDVNLSLYLVSEKLDGVRATWLQGRLITRGGKEIKPPSWFTLHWPQERLDGELFAGRGQFNIVTSTVLDNEPDESMWRKIRFMVFDAPSSQPFRERYRHYKGIIADCDSPYLFAVEQRQLQTQADLTAWLDDVVAHGGEGLMLHLADASFTGGSDNNLIKLKPFMDAEAVVEGYQPGKGKYLGKMGALIVVNEQGRRFKIGTGFSDAQRENPPAIGSTITYSYHGYTRKGLPRFASFMHVRGAETQDPKD
ncbi:DNA ligase [Pseudoalteromonas sp. GB56]